MPDHQTDFESLLFQELPDPVLLLAQALIIDNYNPAAERLLGLDAHPHQRLDAFFDPQSCARLAQAMEAGEDLFLCDGELHRPRSLPVNLKLKRLGELTPPRYLLIVRDITIRRQYERWLLDSNQRFEDIALTMGDWIWEVDAAGRYTYCSERIADILGYQPDEVIGKTPFDLMPADEARRLEAYFQDLVQSGEHIVNLENWNTARDGHRVCLLTNAVPLRDGEGRVRGYRGVDKDITERIRLTDQLIDVAEGVSTKTGSDFFSHTVQRLCAVLKANHVFIAELFQDDGLQARTLAAARDGVLVENFTYRLNDSPCAEVIQDRLCVYGRGVQQQFPQDRMLAQIHIEAYLGTPLYDASGSVVGLLVALFRKPLDDVELIRSFLQIFAAIVSSELERRRASRTRQELEKQLRHAQKLEAVGTLAGGIAHDFNNILSIILGNAEILQERGQLDAQQQPFLGNILQATERARDLVRQILTFSRKTDQRVVTLDLGRRLDDALGLIRATIPKSIEVRLQRPDQPLPIVADPTQIDQILLNLCTNAYHAMAQPGGRIDIQVQPLVLDEAQARVLDLPRGSYAALDITDQGGGIAEEIQERIFEPFFTTKLPGEGTGLGLSTVHGIAKAHGGSIYILYSDASGTCFRVLLPLQPGVEPPAQQPLTSAPSGPARILVIDDELMLTELLQEMLGTGGYEVICYNDPEQALAHLREAPADAYDLVLTDHNMPVLNGEALTAQLRQLGRRVPVILMSGYNVAPSATLEQLDISAVLQKPLTRQELLETVHAVLARG